MDAIEPLSHDHRMVEQLFRDYEAAASETQRRGVVEILVRELSKRAALEELIVYPLAKNVLPDGDQAVDERLKTHMDVKQTLVNLDRAVTDESFPCETADQLMSQIRQQVDKHIREDEGDLLPRLARELDRDTLNEIGDVLEQGKHFAPTRAHPSAPDQPLALALAAPVAAVFDRLRDRLGGRPQT